MAVSTKEQFYPWTDVIIESWQQFEESVGELASRDWVFRGQCDANWELQTSISRLFDDVMEMKAAKSGKVMKFDRHAREKIMIESFIAGAHLYIQRFPEEKDLLEWLAIMQHHGAPTRLLDVTFSPYIALYFALERGNQECCVFAFNHKELYRKFEESIFETKDYKIELFKYHHREKSFIIPYEPKIKTERILAQQGLFLIPSNINKLESFQTILSRYNVNRKVCIRYRISPTLRYQGLVWLRKMNITSTSLFPGLDGFCRSIGFEVIESLQRLGRVY